MDEALRAEGVLHELGEERAEHLTVDDRARHPGGLDERGVVVQAVPVPGGAGVGDHVDQGDGALEDAELLARGEVGAHDAASSSTKTMVSSLTARTSPSWLV